VPFTPYTDDLTKLLTGPGFILYTPDLSTLRLPTPSAPVPTPAGTGGTVAAGTYLVAVTYVNAYGETLASGTGSVTTTGSTSTISTPSPPAAGTGLPGIATGWNCYISQAAGSVCYKQNSTPTAIGSPFVLTAPPTTTGAVAPLLGVAWDTSAALPQKLDDVVSLTSPYTIKPPWLPGGALSRDNISLVRTIATSTITTAHTTQPVTARVTGTSRSLQIPFQEVKPEIRAIAENAPGIETIAQGAPSSGTPAQSRVRMGGIQQLTRRRFFVITERDPAIAGVTTEGGARGQLVGYVLFNTALSAQGTNLDEHPDNAVAQAVQFDAFPEPGAPDMRYSHGSTVFETGFTIP